MYRLGYQELLYPNGCAGMTGMGNDACTTLRHCPCIVTGRRVFVTTNRSEIGEYMEFDESVCPNFAAEMYTCDSQLSQRMLIISREM